MYVSKMCSYVASLLMELATEAIEMALWTLRTSVYRCLGMRLNTLMHAKKNANKK